MAAVHETERPRAGRRFEPTHERALCDNALVACESLPGAHRGVMAVREMVGPIGIPDYTALVGDRTALDARLALDVSPVLNQVDAAIVATAHSNVARTPNALALALGWPLCTVERRIPGLVKCGALSAGPSGGLRRPTALQTLGRLYAIEMKVRDRNAAVQQARTYGVWADAYVLVMGSLSSRPLERLLDDVTVDRAGLMVDGHWLRRPILSQLDVARRFWAAEHFVAAVRGGSYQPSVLA